jgi:hypothetical protein
MTPTSLTPDELALLLEVDGGAPVSAEARALHAIGHAIREATSGGVDVADDVMLSLALQSATSGRVDVADDVMLSLALQSATSGGVDVADDVMLSLALQSATGGGVDVADDVMLSLALQSATGGGVDVANDVMAEVRPLRTAPTMPQWASLGGMGALFAMAAAALFFIQASSVGMVPPVELHAEAHLPRLTLASFNDAEVEDISAPDSAAVSVMQFSEGGPTIIFVQESEG